MAWIYEEMLPSPIENAKVLKMIENGVCKGHKVIPYGGYVLHDAAYDLGARLDEWGNTVSEPVPGYRGDAAICSGVYDFENVFKLNGIDACGARAFYAVPSKEIPASLVFGSAVITDESGVKEKQ